MFEVSWTDPTRETVGQRKNRKARSKNGESLFRTTSAHSSGPGNSISPETKSSFLNIFGASRRLSVHRNRAESRPRPTPILVETDPANSGRTSIYTAPSDRSMLEYSGTAIIQAVTLQDRDSYRSERNSEVQNSEQSDVSDSIFSERTGRSTRTNSTWSLADSGSGMKNIAQPLDSASFISQNSDLTISPRASVNASEHVATIVHITTAGTPPIQVYDPSARSIAPETYEFPIPIIRQHKRTPTPLIITEKTQQQATVLPLVVPSKQSDGIKLLCRSEDPPNLPLPKLPENFTPARQDTRRNGETKRRKVSATFRNLQRSIRRMEAASSKIMLERLKEEWIRAADASIYRELELEKQLWMLTALRMKCGPSPTPQAQNTSKTEVSKILSLFENQASASTLSALTTESEVHHLSTKPLRQRSYPNVHATALPEPTPHLPYLPKSFTAIHAFSLPSILPASSIPQALKECHRILTSASPPSPQSQLSTSPESPNTQLPSSQAGKLHLTIVDPSPLAQTIGPLLREWLDTHLLIHLETQFRCMNPSRLFPIWLEKAGLRGDGSTILNIQFLACFTPCSESEIRTPINDDVNGKNTTGGRTDEKKTTTNMVSFNDYEGNTKNELRSVVGRMLWREMWGQFVLGEKWWWEDEKIVEECVRLGTSWEYALIEGVKEG